MDRLGQSDLDFLWSNLPSSERQLQLPSNPDQVAQVATAPPRLYQRRENKKIHRPSTAPSRHESERVQRLLSLDSDEPLEGEVTSPFLSVPEVKFGCSYRESERKTDDNSLAPAGSSLGFGCAQLGPINGIDLGAPPSPFTTSNLQLDDIMADGSSGSRQPDVSTSEYDWPGFISAYANGRWDPNIIPKFPRSSSISTTGFPNSAQGLTSQFTPPDTDSVSGSPHARPMENTSKSDARNPPPVTFRKDDLPTRPTTTSPSRAKVMSRPSNRLRMTFAEVRASNEHLPSNILDFGSPSDHSRTASNPDAATAAATMRWAAAHVDLSPLALPSPERDLTDPMRGVTAPIPGSHPVDAIHTHELMTPGGTRRSRLANFWSGTRDVEPNQGPPQRLATFPESPSETPSSSGSQNEITTLPSSQPPYPSVNLSTAVPASAPAIDASSSDSKDYFRESHSDNRIPAQTNDDSHGFLRSPTPLYEQETSTVPMVPKRLNLSRHTSAPLPSLPMHDHYHSDRRGSESVNLNSGRVLREERLFQELKFLAPPNPPDEFERRRALYNYNVWSTGPDLCFDRIAHLAKLVFNANGVCISLVNATDQWFKSEWGMKMSTCPRTYSFCGHAILQRGDEPLVILDATADWRFAKNPLVLGTPEIRFYAGAPLRTQSGYNIGSLAVVSDTPRTEFTPRQRHTLKEFAAIAMREMELWRDKIQLRIRDRIQNSMEQFCRECLEIDAEQSLLNHEDSPGVIVGASMDRVYDRAAKLIQRTLDVEGAMVIDVSHSEVLETMSAEGSVSVVIYSGDPETPKTTKQLTSEEYERLNSFFEKNPDGKITEGMAHVSFRPFLPLHLQYALISAVPIFNVDKRPFALLCAYNATDQTKYFLEGYELSYLRAIGVIILSAVLKRRMILADKAKSLFISKFVFLVAPGNNILNSFQYFSRVKDALAWAVELLAETSLNHSQASFLQTVQACGTSLVETVNHVLDFTKLSGNSKAGGVENVIPPTTVDLMQLVEDAVDGAWIGHRARTAELRDSGIGSVYSPPQEGNDSSHKETVETVIDIGHREGGWLLKCEKGGIRRVLTNLFGNSLKFTTGGYVHVSLRQLPHSAITVPGKIRLELSVNDTGKGISQNFLKNQLFHPFSQENPLQTGTGLGLAIVNSIVHSESIGGKVDVCSEEGVGTEIKVSFNAETVEGDEESASAVSPLKLDERFLPEAPTVSFIGFQTSKKGSRLLIDVLRTYVCSWWGLQEQPEGSQLGNIVILNDDPAIIVTATRQRDPSRPFILLSSSRGNAQVMNYASEYERIGGFCRIVYKPGGPSRLRAVLKLCVHALSIMKRPSDIEPVPTLVNGQFMLRLTGPEPRHFDRRNSEEAKPQEVARPRLAPRSTTVHPLFHHAVLPSMQEESAPSPEREAVSPTITIGNDGSLLRSSIGTTEILGRKSRVLVIEDNVILRQLLVKWLKTRGFVYRAAEDGRLGVDKFENEGPFDVVLLDLSMPVLDGIGATREIRKIESNRLVADHSQQGNPARILALTGMSSLEDKRRAFAAGVDGYLVKPVAFKILEEMFQKLGVS